MHRVTKTRTAVVLLAAAAIAAPSASAKPIDYPLPAGVYAGSGSINADDSGGSGTGGTSVALTRTVEGPSSGFDWGDAGLGAAGMLSMIGLGAGAVIIGRRSRRSHPAIS